MLLVCISVYLKSILRYKFLTLDTYHPDTLYLREQECEDPWLFFAAKRGSVSKRVSETLAYSVIEHHVRGHIITKFIIHFELFNDIISSEQLMHLTVYHSCFVFRMYGVLLSDQRSAKITRFCFAFLSLFRHVGLCHDSGVFFFFAEGPRSRSYGRTAALSLLVQPCDEDD
jgi:hypothetical protein